MGAAEKIKKLRLELGLSQREFAQKLGVHYSVISNYERGLRLPGFPTLRKMIELAKKQNIKLRVEDIRSE